MVRAVVHNVFDVGIVLSGQHLQVVIHQAVDGRIERIGNGRNGHQRELRMVVLDVADVGDRQFRAVSQFFLGETQLFAGSPDPDSDSAVI